MSFQVTTAMIQQYNANIALVSQQKKSRLEGCVRRERLTAEFEYFDQIGPTEAQPKNGRHADTPLMSTPHMRRRVSGTPYNWADLVDTTDKLRMLTDPTSVYTMNAVAAFNRAKDSVIINAAFAAVQAGDAASGESAAGELDRGLDERRPRLAVLLDRCPRCRRGRGRRGLVPDRLDVVGPGLVGPHPPQQPARVRLEPSPVAPESKNRVHLIPFSLKPVDQPSPIRRSSSDRASSTTHPASTPRIRSARISHASASR